MTEGEAVSIARAVAEREGWAWVEPAHATFRRTDLTSRAFRQQIGAGLVLMALLNCKDSSSVRLFKATGTTSEMSEAAAELELVAKETGLTFPAGSRLLGVSRDKGIDYILQAKVELPESEFDEFLAASPIEPGRLEVGGNGSIGPSNAFWDPSQASQLRTAQVMMGSKSLNIGAGTPVDGKVTVLIVFFTT